MGHGQHVERDGFSRFVIYELPKKYAAVLCLVVSLLTRCIERPSESLIQAELIFFEHDTDRFPHPFEGLHIGLIGSPLRLLSSFAQMLATVKTQLARAIKELSKTLMEICILHQCLELFL